MYHYCGLVVENPPSEVRILACAYTTLNTVQELFGDALPFFALEEWITACRGEAEYALILPISAR